MNTQKMIKAILITKNSGNASPSPEAVSYTHLDVYKRQAIPSDNTIPAIPDIVSAAWKDERIPSVKKKLRINAPVSYTHLDVYKRQVLFSD